MNDDIFWSYRAFHQKVTGAFVKELKYLSSEEKALYLALFIPDSDFSLRLEQEHIRQSDLLDYLNSFVFD